MPIAGTNARPNCSKVGVLTLIGLQLGLRAHSAMPL